VRRPCRRFSAAAHSTRVLQRAAPPPTQHSFRGRSIEPRSHTSSLFLFTRA
jgi:hypothetical protein